MDLLYSGYIESKMIQKKENLIIFQPNKTKLERKIIRNYFQSIKKGVFDYN